MKKAAIYIRVSTDAQREEGYSIDAQREMLTAYCVSKAIKSYDYYIDGGYSGSNLDRPQLNRMIDDIQSEKISHVLVYKLDRLSRSQKDTLYLIEDVFNPNGVDFISLNESMDTSTPLGRLMLGILSAFAQLERENIRERTRMGMKERVKLGYWMGGGRVPFGYDYDSNRGILVQNSDAETVRAVYELYLKGYSTARIAKILGLKYEKLARQILMRKSNAGYIVYNGEEYRGRHEPIISPETYDEAMRLMRERSDKKGINPQNFLTGLMYCAECGSKLRYQKWGDSGRRILCYTRDKSKQYITGKLSCDNEIFDADEIEQAIISDLFEFSIKQEKIETSDAVKSVTEVLRQRYTKTAERIKRLYNLYADSGDELLTETINEQKKELAAISEQLKNEQEKARLTDKVRTAKKRLSTLRESWKFMTYEERRSVITSCVERIEIGTGGVKIYYKF